MNAIQTRIQGGVTVSLPPYPRLVTLENEAAALRAAIRESEDRMGQLDYEQTHGRVSADQRVALKAESDRLYREKQIAATQLQNKTSESEQWREFFAFRIYRKDQLLVEMAGAPAERFSMATRDIGQEPARSREAIQEELLIVLRELAGFSGDAKAVEEYERTAQGFLDEAGVIITRRGYAWSSLDPGTRELVLHTDPRARQVAFGKAWRVPRDIAEKTGLLEMEAQNE
ncbi:MAG: hypothetical protein ACR2HX_16710 [Pyrinomonadaceae bacterium]